MAMHYTTKPDIVCQKTQYTYARHSTSLAASKQVRLWRPFIRYTPAVDPTHAAVRNWGELRQVGGIATSRVRGVSSSVAYLLREYINLALALFLLQKSTESAILYHCTACSATPRKEFPIMHLLLYSSILLTTSAIYVPLQLRADAGEQEVAETEMVDLDATTSDGAAGIGAEFETPLFSFDSLGCSPDDTNAARKEIVGGRTGTNWMLTADTGAGQGKLYAEYILNGQNIKVGSGDAARAGAAAAQDFVSRAAIRLRVLSH